MVSNISSAKAIQPDLFEYDPILSMKHRSISAVIDRINARLGMDSIILASQQYFDGSENHGLKKFSTAIKRALLSPDYSTSFEAFVVR